MAPLGNIPFLAAAKGSPYKIPQSLRFDGSSGYLNWTPSSAGDRTLWTWSAWIKRSGLSSTVGLFGSYAAANNTDYLEILFASGNNLLIQGNTTAFLKTSQLFRDTSAWYHIVIAVDTSNATANDRIKLWVNGEQVTAFDTRNNPSSGGNLGVNQAGVHRLGRRPNGTDYFNGYMAEVNFIDGSALGPESFGKTNAHGVWTPVYYSGAYTGNSFYLKFASGDGTDSSGLSNTWTANNFTTSGTGTDVMSDTPTTNYATLNPLWYRNTYGLSTLSNGNLEFSDAGISTSWGGRGSTFEISSGKWYMEWKCTDSSGQNLVLAVLNTGHYGLEHFMVQNPQSQTGCWGPQENGTSRWIILDGVQTTSGAPYYDTLNGVVVGIAIDADAGTATWYRNGTAITSLTDVDISTSSKDAWVVMGITSNGSGTSFVANFGQRAFEQTPPTGYSAWNTSNLPAPTVKDGSDYFNTVKFTAGTTTVSGVGFQPDWVWAKNRDQAYNHRLIDAVRGVKNDLYSNTTASEQTNQSDSLLTFTSDGFTHGKFGSADADDFVAWNWLAGNGTSSISTGSVDGTNPTIASTVSANPTAGFSIVTYTGNGTNSATVGHGLGVAPAVILVKDRGAANHWAVVHTSCSITGTTSIVSPEYKMLRLDATDAEFDYQNLVVSPGQSSSTFTLGNQVNVNGSGNTYVAYCFAEVEGYSKFGSYTGNGSTDGPFVATSFTPSWVMLKRSDSSGTDWIIQDAARSTYNVVDDILRANTNQAEASGNSNYYIDFLSNGIKLRTISAAWNASGGTYVFACFASNPFGGSGVSPATAR